MSEKKTIPHEHWCSVCKRPEACEDAFCERPLWHVCSDRPHCQQIYANATVHVYTEQEILPCCGISKFMTPQGDRMTTDPARVTCRRPGEPAYVAPQPPTLGAPGHVPGCLCNDCIALQQDNALQHATIEHF